MKKVVCIYPAHSHDAVAAAACVYLRHPDVTLLPIDRNVKIPNFWGCHVYVVDFSFELLTTMIILETSDKVTFIDHHIKTMETYFIKREDSEVRLLQAELQKYFDIGKLMYFFDTERSSAMLAWDYLFPGKDPPAVLSYIQDHYLATNKYEETKYVQLALTSLNNNVVNYALMFSLQDQQELLTNLVTGGKAIADYIAVHLKQIVSHAYPIRVEANRRFYQGIAVNAPHFMVSDVAHALLEKQGNARFAVVWQKAKNLYRYSLVSDETRIDVNELAQAIDSGGYGHRCSASFSLSENSPLNKQFLTVHNG